MQKNIEKILVNNGPIKAKNIAKILENDFGIQVDRSEVNSILYRLKTMGQAEKLDNHEWIVPRKKRTAAPSPSPVANAVIKFTPEQQLAIDLDPEGHLLIRGQAGCGKTTVLAARAQRVLTVLNKGSILFLTYNSALAGHISKQLKSSSGEKSVKVDTFHQWAKNSAKLLGYEFNGWVESRVRVEKIVEFIEHNLAISARHRLFLIAENDKLKSWWSDEFAWILGQYITHYQEYVAVARSGRGTSIRLDAADKKIVWGLFEEYLEWLDESGQEDYDNPGGIVLRVLMEKNLSSLPENMRYDHVFVDEVQDFDKSWLVVTAQAARVSLTLAGDVAQKIYKRNFTWASVGISIHGRRSRSLIGNHRTTKQVMDLALQLLEKSGVKENSDYVQPIIPNRLGYPVNLLIRQNPIAAYEAGYDWVVSKFKRISTATVVLAFPNSNQLFPSIKTLKDKGLEAKAVRGTTLGRVESGIIATTYHQLKGLEFDHVVVFGMHDSQFPGRFLSRVEEEERLEEERLLLRLLYVVMTRSKKTLTLIGSKPFCRFFDAISLDNLTKI